MTPVLLDTGVIVSLLDRSEASHSACSDVISNLDAPLVTCEAVISESCYLLRRLQGASEAILDNVIAGIFQIPFQLSRESTEVKQILRRYRDQKIDFADACLINMANTFGTADVLTLDRDFTIYRWGKNKPFRLLLNPK